jgi:cytochrome P450
MRMSPPLTYAFPKKVPAGGDIVCGKVLPAGTNIHISFVSLMRDEETFGADTNIFRPERFIDCDAATKAKRLKIVDLLFGHGRWLCLGKSLALIEMNKIFVEVSKTIGPLSSVVTSIRLEMLKVCLAFTSI